MAHRPVAGRAMTRRRRSALASACWLASTLWLAGAAAAVEPDEVLADPAMEERAREISRDLRCLVCQNQSIDDSDAELARDLRVLVRERLVAGDSDSQVIDYVVSRYGDFVLLRPPFKATTYALWFGPAAVLVIGGAAVLLFYRRRRTSPAAADGPLTEDEQRRLAALTKHDDG